MGTSVTFLGVGDASQSSLGHASMTIEVDDQLLMVDCGPGALQSHIDTFQCLPDALFITHCHLDHIADFEKLFIKCWFHRPDRHMPKVFVPAPIISLLHDRIGTYPEALAEGGVNFWEAFQLIPVSTTFEFSTQTFSVFPARHHGFNSAFSLCLPNVFFYSGDTRPVPEIVESDMMHGAVIFHDCSVIGNPSHSGIDDLLREYSEETLKKIQIYHYNHPDQKEVFASRGLQCIDPGSRYDFG